MKKKILYITDLDGTLLNTSIEISDYTAEAVNSLIDKGMIFSYATARSRYTSSKLTKNIKITDPVVIYNGTFLYDPLKEKRILSNAFSPSDAQKILDRLLKNGTYPMVHAFYGDAEKYLFDEKNMSKGMADFQSKRERDERRTPVDVYEIDSYEVFYFTCIDDSEKLYPLFLEFKDEFQCLYTKDIYSGDYWLEILPNRATKASAIKELKKILECDKVICFGDGTNDIAMFKEADEAYAVSNAHPELKKYATSVIDSNDNDGVAKWLLKNYGRTD
ncbi:MAG: HAD family phosphatase [Clostridia bacterium]|nr:HAD family phosphatase [Clostridia bacterium]